MDFSKWNDDIEKLLGSDMANAGLSLSFTTKNQEEIVRRSLFWLLEKDIIGKTKLSILFKGNTTKSGVVKQSPTGIDWFKITFNSIHVEDHFQHMLEEECPRQIAHVSVAVHEPGVKHKPHGVEWRKEASSMIGRDIQTVSTSLDNIKRLRKRGGGYVFCECVNNEGRTAVNKAFIERIREGEKEICKKCGSEYIAEPVRNNSIPYWEQPAVKSMVEKAIEEADLLMKKEAEERERRLNEEGEIRVFCKCSADAPGGNFKLLKDLPKNKMLICLKCNSPYKPIPKESEF